MSGPIFANRIVNKSNGVETPARGKTPSGTDPVDSLATKEAVDAKINSSEKGAGNGVATLNAAGELVQPLPADSVSDTELGDRTADPLAVPSGTSNNTVGLTTWLSWLINRIKAITGAVNWYDAPATTLAATATHIGSTANPHGVTAGQTGAYTAGQVDTLLGGKQDTLTLDPTLAFIAGNLAVVPNTSNQRVQILNNGTSVGTRKAVNFIPGAKVAFTIADDATNDRINLTIATTGAAASGANSDITSLSGLTTPLTTGQGGTGATTASQALANLGGIPLSQKGAANGVATLGADSRIPSAQLPPLAITDTFVVNSEAAMLALAAQVGDVAVRTESDPPSAPATYILQAEPASTLANWVKLQTPPDAVLSVNGLTGAVSLETDDIPEGATNLYFTDARVYAKAKAILQASTNISIVADDVAQTLTISSTNTFLDNTFRIQDDTDPTKQLAFDLGAIATGTTHTVGAPNRSGTMLVSHTALLDAAKVGGTDPAQAIGRSFTTVTLPTVSSDPGGNFNTSTNVFTFPVTGLYLAVGRVRYAEAVTADVSYGVGMHTSNVDGPFFLWGATVNPNVTTARRNGLMNVRISPFTAGQQLRLFSYFDNPTAQNIDSASLQIYWLQPS